jgi:uncharacterized membrane protein
MIYFVILVVVAFYVLERIVPSRQIPVAVSRVVTALCLYVIGEAIWLPVFGLTSGWINEAIGPEFLHHHPQLMILGLPVIPAVLIALMKPVRRRDNGR